MVQAIVEGGFEGFILSLTANQAYDELHEDLSVKNVAMVVVCMVASCLSLVPERFEVNRAYRYFGIVGICAEQMLTKGGFYSKALVVNYFLTVPLAISFFADLILNPRTIIPRQISQVAVVVLNAAYLYSEQQRHSAS